MSSRAFLSLFCSWSKRKQVHGTFTHRTALKPKHFAGRASHNLDEQSAEVSRDLTYSSGELKKTSLSMQAGFVFSLQKTASHTARYKYICQEQKVPLCPRFISKYELTFRAALTQYSLCCSPCIQQEWELQEDGSVFLPSKENLLNKYSFKFGSVCSLLCDTHKYFSSIFYRQEICVIYIHLVFLPLDFQRPIGVVNPAHFRSNMFQILTWIRIQPSGFGTVKNGHASKAVLSIIVCTKKRQVKQ